MTPLWHPLSAVLLSEPPVLASAQALRLLLRGGPLTVRYAGDRMGSALPHGLLVSVRAQAEGPATGSVVLALVEGAPDLLRVGAVEGARVLLQGDGEAGAGQWVERSAILAVADLPRRRVRPWARAASRLLADLREAWGARAEARDGADVRSKYDAQAPFYAESGPTMDPGLLARARAAFAPGGRVLVAGSGVGTECFALAAAGYDVCGIDFAPAMVGAARAEAQRRSLSVRFQEGDLRAHREPSGSLAGILFTYDVYSFLADREERIALLRRMAGWLAPGGAILLSARRARGLWARALLSLQWLAGGGRGTWGASHTRWITVGGDLRRSFVQVFSARALRREAGAAGLRQAGWEGGHGCLTLARAAA
ncbi:MAG TPA: class I SAM-dependent methyltransferase [Candidatus Polarisedimenticolaceae bacterium]|nr:class I SAM-dependent methyltransferase [Candidatus Polarisedimenticolaceae bacterium]